MPQFDFDVYPSKKAWKEKKVPLTGREFWSTKPCVGESVSVAKTGSHKDGVRVRVVDVNHKLGRDTIVIECVVTKRADYRLVKEEGWKPKR
jgi:hypothetical protein